MVARYWFSSQTRTSPWPRRRRSFILISLAFSSAMQLPSSGMCALPFTAIVMVIQFAKDIAFKTLIFTKSIDLIWMVLLAMMVGPSVLQLAMSNHDSISLDFDFLHPPPLNHAFFQVHLKDCRIMSTQTRVQEATLRSSEKGEESWRLCLLCLES